MKKAFDEVLCIRGSGAYKAGVCYPLIGGSIVVYLQEEGVLFGFHPNDVLAGENGMCLEILHGSEQSGARFVKVTRCRKRKSD